MEEAGWWNAQQVIVHQDIDKMRQTIDSLDQTIADLLRQRLALTREIGAIKAGSQLPVKDCQREQKVIDNVQSVTDDPHLAQALANIYQTVMSESRGLQRTICAASESEDVVLYFPNVLIVGMGMIGGALARQIKGRLPATRITAVDNPQSLELARQSGLVDDVQTDLRKAVSKAGMILLCAPPEANVRLLAEIAPWTKRRQVVVDVTSTKEEICRLAESCGMKADFVGGHPLFGSHGSGVQAAADVVVDGKTFCLTPTSRSSELTMRRLARWLSELGLRVVQTDAPQHDQSLAATSHSLQLLAVALGNSLARGRNDQQLRATLTLSGTALRQWSRLMSSPAGLWCQIIRQNQGPIDEALSSLIDELERTRAHVRKLDDGALGADFAEASRVPAMLKEIDS